jgi:ABC-type multidrug transport system ATPase subunit
VLEVKFENVDYKDILHDISFELKAGDFAVLVGHNGAGKSTLLNLLSGKILSTKGTIVLPSDIEFVHQNIEDNLFLDLTVYDNFRLFGVSDSKNIALYLQDFNKVLTLDRKVITLSGGEKQALALALRLYHKPQMLLLDEVTSALDEGASKRLLSLIFHHTRDIICVMVTHDIEEIRSYKHQILRLENGFLVKK